MNDTLRLVNLSGKKGKAAIKTFAESLNADDHFVFKSSGSTGKPKKIEFTKDQLRASADLTANTFNLTSKTIFLCPLSLDYVAGRMMVVRAWKLNSELVYTGPLSNPFEMAGDFKVDFAAFVPLQLQAMLAIPEAIDWLNSMSVILVGGADISHLLRNEIEQFLTAPVYQTYGMTETLTHVAVRRLNGEERSDLYKPLNGVEIDVDKRNRLRVFTPVLGEWLQSNDIVELADGGFRWLGRQDFVINSGGHKISPERIESLVSGGFGVDCALIGIKNEKLGEKAVLVIEGVQNYVDRERIADYLEDLVTPYEIPKEVMVINELPKLNTGKLNRKVLRKMISKSTD